MKELGKPKLDFWLLALNQPINGITYDKLEEACSIILKPISMQYFPKPEPGYPIHHYLLLYVTLLPMSSILCSVSFFIISCDL